MKERTFMKINNGDILSVELLNQLYMFLQIIYQIPRINSQKAEKISERSLLNDFIRWYPGFYIANIVTQISKENELKNRNLMFKGILLPRNSFKDINYKIISQNKITVEDIEFPETIDANRNDGFTLKRGELKITIIEYDKIKKYPQEFIQELENGPSIGFMDIYSLGDSVLYFRLFRHYSGRIIQLEKSKMSNMLFLKSFLREMLPKRHI